MKHKRDDKEASETPISIAANSPEFDTSDARPNLGFSSNLVSETINMISIDCQREFFRAIRLSKNKKPIFSFYRNLGFLRVFIFVLLKTSVYFAIDIWISRSTSFSFFNAPSTGIF
jgi:hypothetical protein